MKRTSILSLIVVFAALVILAVIGNTALSPMSNNATATYPYRLAYRTPGLFHFIDPSNSSTIAVTEKVPDPPGTYIYDFLASPDGRWITFGLSLDNQSNTTIQLLNVINGQMSDPIASGVVASTAYMWGKWNVPQSFDVSWSPNSQYIAFNMRDTRISPNIDIYVYSLAEHKLTDITLSDHSRHYRMAWSPDSKQIFTSADFCDSSETNCRLFLETVDLTGNINSTTGVEEEGVERNNRGQK